MPSGVGFPAQLVIMTRKLCSRVTFEDATERERFRLVTEVCAP